MASSESAPKTAALAGAISGVAVPYLVWTKRPEIFETGFGAFMLLCCAAQLIGAIALHQGRRAGGYTLIAAFVVFRGVWLVGGGNFDARLIVMELIIIGIIVRGIRSLPQR